MLRDALLPEFDHEIQNTRKTLERIPDGRFDYKPHEKSGSLGWLAGHIATLPYWAVMTFSTDSLDLAGQQPPAPPKTSAELLAMFDRNAAEARAVLAKADDMAMVCKWTLRVGDKVMFSMPRVEVFRGMIMNHLIHHRAQLTVYMRMLDIPVPALYGPSADEGQSQFQAA